VELLIDTT